MTDTNVAPDTATEGKKGRKRSIPQGQIVTEVPPSMKTSTWDVEFEWFKQNPGTIKKYDDISQTTPSYLRSRYGLDAKGRNTRNKRVTMYVVYYPEKAEEIKIKAMGKKRRSQQNAEQ